jgi:phage terminase small subunit
MAPTTKGSSLTPKQRRFVAEYLVDLNATRAAIRAGYSAKTAPPAGSRLLTNVKVAAAIAEGQAKQLEQADLHAVEVKKAVRVQVVRDIRRLFDDKGSMRPIHTLSAEDAAMIAGFEVVIKNAAGGDGHTDTVLKIRLTDQAKFVELAMKHLGLLKERVEVEGKMTLEQLIVGSYGDHR